MITQRVRELSVGQEGSCMATFCASDAAAIDLEARGTHQMKEAHTRIRAGRTACVAGTQEDLRQASRKLSFFWSHNTAKKTHVILRSTA